MGQFNSQNDSTGTMLCTSQVGLISAPLINVMPEKEWQSDGTKNFIRWERDATKWAGSVQQIDRT